MYSNGKIFRDLKRSFAKKYLETREVNDKIFYVCKCGLWFRDMLQAFACEDYTKRHHVTSIVIARLAVASTYCQPSSHAPLIITEIRRPQGDRQ